MCSLQCAIQTTTLDLTCVFYNLCYARYVNALGIIPIQLHHCRGMERHGTAGTCPTSQLAYFVVLRSRDLLLDQRCLPCVADARKGKGSDKARARKASEARGKGKVFWLAKTDTTTSWIIGKTLYNIDRNHVCGPREWALQSKPMFSLKPLVTNRTKYGLSRCGQ